jgi:hypothetical protein
MRKQRQHRRTLCELVVVQDPLHLVVCSAQMHHVLTCLAMAPHLCCSQCAPRCLPATLRTPECQHVCPHLPCCRQLPVPSFEESSQHIQVCMQQVVSFPNSQALCKNPQALCKCYPITLATLCCDGHQVPKQDPWSFCQVQEMLLGTSVISLLNAVAVSTIAAPCTRALLAASQVRQLRPTM